jgi:AcrR family transcriptional regulator
MNMANIEHRERVIAQIQNAARELFLSRGYAKTSMRAIASKSGLSPSAIYHYFVDKKKLFDSLAIPHAEDLNPMREQRRDKIICAALELLTEKGFDGLKMDDIAVRVGISKPMLYQFFESKEELFITALREAPASLVVSRTTAALLEGTELRKYIRAIGDGFFRAFDAPERRTLLHMIISKSTEHPEIGSGFFKEGPFVQYDIITSYFRDHKSCDEEIVEKIRNAFIAFWGSLQAYVVFFKVMGGESNPPDQDVYLDVATEFFCSYMEKLGITAL